MINDKRKNQNRLSKTMNRAKTPDKNSSLKRSLTLAKNQNLVLRAKGRKEGSVGGDDGGESQ